MRIGLKTQVHIACRRLEDILPDGIALEDVYKDHSGSKGAALEGNPEAQYLMGLLFGISICDAGGLDAMFLSYRAHRALHTPSTSGKR